MRKRWEDFKAALERGRRFVAQDVWEIGRPGEEVPHGIIIKQVRVTILLIQGVVQEMLLLRASALTFATTLFIVPFLAFMFYFIQTFNLGDQFYRSLSNRMEARLAWVVETVGGETPEHVRENAEAAQRLLELFPEGGGGGVQGWTFEQIQRRDGGLSRDRFDALDADGDGRLLLEEARQAAQRASRGPGARVARETGEMTQRLLEALPGSGETPGDEWGFDALSGYDDALTRELFGLMDLNGDGLVSRTELQSQRQLNNELLQRQIMSTIFPILAPENGANELLRQQDVRNPVEVLMDLAEKGASNPQALTVTGILFVLSTVFGFMRNVESSFNSIWGVKRRRSFMRAISDYLLITLLLPFVAAAVLGLTAALESNYIVQILGPFSFALRGMQMGVICLLFTGLYYFVPNTQVYFRYAVMGGMLAGLLWVFTSWGYVKFQFGLTRYTPFFSSFALFPLLLMWTYVSWLILLFGALLTYAYQNEKTFAMERFAGGATYAYREALAVRAMVEMTRRFLAGRPGLSVQEAGEAWNVPTRLLNDVLERLIEVRLVSPCATEPPSFQPARSPEKIQVNEVVQAMREYGQDPSLLRHEQNFQPLYDGLDAMDHAFLDAPLAEVAARLEPRLAGEGDTDVPATV